MVKCATPLERKGLGQSSEAERIPALSTVDDYLVYTKEEETHALHHAGVSTPSTVHPETLCMG